jgi:biopolymer transport protein ExbB
LRDYKFIITKRNYLKLLKLKKWQTLKKESTSNGGGMVSGLIIAACIGVGVIIWKFIMGNPEILKEEYRNRYSIEYFRSSISRWCSCTSIIRNVVNGSCFNRRFFVISKAAGKTN